MDPPTVYVYVLLYRQNHKYHCRINRSPLPFLFIHRKKNYFKKDSGGLRYRQEPLSNLSRIFKIIVVKSDLKLYYGILSISCNDMRKPLMKFLDKCVMKRPYILRRVPLFSVSFILTIEGFGSSQTKITSIVILLIVVS